MDYAGPDANLSEVYERRRSLFVCWKHRNAIVLTDLEDLRDQMLQMQRMGGVASLLEKLPGAAQLPAAAREQADDKQVKRQIAIINSMTPEERRNPDVIRGSRKRRIAAGSGTQVQEVNRLLKQFEQMARMMKQLRKGGGLQRLLGGRRPPSGFPS